MISVAEVAPPRGLPSTESVTCGTSWRDVRNGYRTATRQGVRWADGPPKAMKIPEHVGQAFRPAAGLPPGAWSLDIFIDRLRAHGVSLK